MSPTGEVKGGFYLFVAVSTRRMWGEHNAPAAFTPPRKDPGTHLERRLSRPQSRPECKAQGKNFNLHRDSNPCPYRQEASVVPLSHRDSWHEQTTNMPNYLPKRISLQRKRLKKTLTRKKNTPTRQCPLPHFWGGKFQRHMTEKYDQRNEQSNI